MLNTRQAAHYLNLAPQTLRKWACLESGPIRPVRINGRLAWPRSELEKIAPPPVTTPNERSFAYLNSSAETWAARRNKSASAMQPEDSDNLAGGPDLPTAEQLRTALAAAFALASRVEVSLLRDDIKGATQNLNKLLELLERDCDNNAIFPPGDP